MNIFWIKQTDHPSALVFNFYSKIAFPDNKKKNNRPSSPKKNTCSFTPLPTWVFISIFNIFFYFYFFLSMLLSASVKRLGVSCLWNFHQFCPQARSVLKLSCIFNRPVLFWPGFDLQTPPSLIHLLFDSFNLSSFSSRSSKHHKS